MSRRQQIEQTYGFAFPDEVFAFDEFLNDCGPALACLELGFEGPLAILAGAWPEGQEPRRGWPRYYYDPPELFTVMTGSVDGLHWGYWIDAPGETVPVAAEKGVASFYNSDSYEMEEEPTLFDALRTHVERVHRDALEYLHDDPDYADDYRAQLDELASIRDSLRTYAPGQSDAVGGHYVPSASTRRPLVDTLCNMGVVAPKGAYRRLGDEAHRSRGSFRPTAEELADLAARRSSRRRVVRTTPEGERRSRCALGRRPWSPAAPTSPATRCRRPRSPCR